MSINSYPSIYALGHNAIGDILDGNVVVEEKIDGSQFSFSVVNGELLCRSKGQQIVVGAEDNMFQRAVATAQELKPLLTEGWVYRCEYLQKPKHNTLAYERTPRRHLILFDVMIGEEEYLFPARKHEEAKRIGLEVVPLLYRGFVQSLDMVKELLHTPSILGGKIEGVVIKNYHVFTKEKKIAIAKFVSDDFKEQHATEWKKSNPTQSDIVQRIIETYRHEGRWVKAVQHLRDNGDLKESLRDIAGLIREVPADVQKECEEEIKQILWSHFWPQIKRGITAGLPEWYKTVLASSAFESR